jgi:hypothetical protein
MLMVNSFHHLVQCSGFEATRKVKGRNRLWRGRIGVTRIGACEDGEGEGSVKKSI